jgi:hypothetical protein
MRSGAVDRHSGAEDKRPGGVDMHWGAEVEERQAAAPPATKNCQREQRVVERPVALRTYRRKRNPKDLSRRIVDI